MVTVVVWRGTHKALLALQAAIDRNCECQRNEAGIVTNSCGAHKMLVDQRTMDHLAFVYVQVERFMLAEFEGNEPCHDAD